MKKKTLGLLAAILSVCMLAGCGAKDTGDGTGTSTGTGTESTALKDMDVDKYVTLGEYKGLAASVDTVEVDEDEWDTLVNNVYYENITAENGGIMDRAVETGDTVNIDYEGKKDDVAFDGGTAQGYDLTIGSGSFIAGFEDGLIGVMPGETVDLDLTFPENYGNSDLAGQAVVFTVTVNYIQPAQDGEFSDEIISNFGIDGVTNEEELRQYAYDYLNENAQQNYETNGCVYGKQHFYLRTGSTGTEIFRCRREQHHLHGVCLRRGRRHIYPVLLWTGSGNLPVYLC